MKPTELARYQAILEGMLTRVGTRLERREEIAIENTADAIDETGNAADRELAVSQLELASRRQHELKWALRRIEDGTFGMCLECDADISVKRLNAVPWVLYCISCQEMVEHSETRCRMIAAR